MSDDKLSVVQTFFECYVEGRVDDIEKFLDPNVEFDVPGKGAPAGTFVGPKAVERHLERFLEMTEKPINVLQWEDWLVGMTDIAAVARLQLQRPGRLQSFRVIFLVGVSENNKIIRVEAFYSDPDAFERFFA